MKQVAVALCISLVACQSKDTGDSNAVEGTPSAEAIADAEPIGTMLKAGKPEACAHPAVKADLTQRLHNGLTDLEKYPPTSNTLEEVKRAEAEVPMPEMTNFQALDSNNVGAMTCAVSIGETNISYILRPSLENETEFLIAFPNGEPDFIWKFAVLRKLGEWNVGREKPHVGGGGGYGASEQANTVGNNQLLEAEPTPEPEVHNAM